MMIEWADESRTRQGLYRLIGEALRPPGREHLDVLPAAAAYLVDRDIDRFAYGPRLRRYAGRLSEGVDLEEIQVEYVRLFGVGLRKTPAPPVESYYRASDQGAIAEFVAELQREYGTMGVALTSPREAPDHVSTEFDVLSLLAGQEVEAWESSDSDRARESQRTQARFLKRHPVVWLPIFARAAGAADASPYYTDLVELAHGVAVHDADYLYGVLKGSRRS